MNGVDRHKRIVEAYKSNLKAIGEIEDWLNEIAKDLHKIKSNLETLTVVIKNK